MKPLLAGLALTCLAAAPAFAALPVGAAAPTFSAPASLGGKVFNFDLAAAMKKGPVVLYFYPAATGNFERHSLTENLLSLSMSSRDTPITVACIF